MSERYGHEKLAAAVASAQSWADLMRQLDLSASGGQRRVLQEKVAELGLDTKHFKQRSPWRKYPDEAIAAAAACSSTLREVAARLGATPASGTMSHIARRITAAGIDISHFPSANQVSIDLPFTRAQLADAAATSQSIRGVARTLGVPDDSRSRAALGRMLKQEGIDTSHFGNARVTISENSLRAAVPGATSYAGVMRALGLPVNDTNHRRVRRRIAQLALDASHFIRRPRNSAPPHKPKPTAAGTLVQLPQGSPRTNRARLHRALQEIGVPYRCVSCDNAGEWLGQRITLQIDHISGDWLDNRAENLRYLCPNCHALTDTWGRSRRSRPLVTQANRPVH
ncbi:HNH endonuclease signature motif containing protein [Streptomyces sp. NPDC006711]|uniref:HNH endonuclease signature motif containing protein n=1 Tax=unclassified Streptomyces TaxID=2593676 RepID=UPI0033C7B3D7